MLGSRIPTGEINEGQVELPSPGILVDVSGAKDLQRALAARYRCQFLVGERLGAIRHSITNHRIAFSIYAAELRGHSKIALDTLGISDPDIPWTTASRKALQAVSS